MTPAFRILADNQNITARLSDRLLSLTVSDQKGYRSDTVEVRLDDRDGRIELPRKGAELDVALGYEERGLAAMGLYTVDEVELSGAPDTLTIRAKAASRRKSLKQHQTRAWHDTTLGDLVTTIAAAHNLDPRVGETLRSIPIPHLDQTEESDLHLLTRLGKQYDSVAKPVRNYLLFVPSGQTRSATGKTIPTITIHRNETRDYRITLADRGRYQAVKAHWHDTNTGERREASTGQGKPIYTLRHSYPDEARARDAARAKLKALSRGLATLKFSLNSGNPLVVAEAKLTLEGFRDGMNGPWIATQVTHELDTNGLTTRVEAEAPKR